MRLLVHVQLRQQRLGEADPERVPLPNHALHGTFPLLNLLPGPSAGSPERRSDAAPLQKVLPEEDRTPSSGKGAGVHLRPCQHLEGSSLVRSHWCVSCVWY